MVEGGGGGVEEDVGDLRVTGEDGGMTWAGLIGIVYGWSWDAIGVGFGMDVRHSLVLRYGWDCKGY